jgi:hypothetical protein
MMVLDEADLRRILMMLQSALSKKVEVADLFTGENVKTFEQEDMQALAKGENCKKSSMIVLRYPHVIATLVVL